MFDAGVTLQVWRPPADDDETAVDAHGNRDTDPVRASDLDEDGWAIAPPYTPTDAAEPFEANRSEVVDVQTGYREGPTGLLASDEVDWGRGRYKLIGEPAQWPDPWGGGVVGSVIRLERVSG